MTGPTRAGKGIGAATTDPWGTPGAACGGALPAATQDASADADATTAINSDAPESPTERSNSDAEGTHGQHLVRCEWGPLGTTCVAGTGAAVVVVDVLSWATSVSVLVERGTAVFPCRWHDGRAAEAAASHGAVLAVQRGQATAEHPWSLSPAALRHAPDAQGLLLPSPNGSVVAATATGLVLAASLRNAVAVGRWLRQRGYGVHRPLAVVPAGERWPDGSLRPALEDLLGAGAVLQALRAPEANMSPEAAVARLAYAAMTRREVASAVSSCVSARELADGGYADDVDVALEIDTSDAVPVLVDGGFRDRSTRS